MSCHHRPENPLPALRFADGTAPSEAEPAYRVLVVNGVGL